MTLNAPRPGGDERLGGAGLPDQPANGPEPSKAWSWPRARWTRPGPGTIPPWTRWARLAQNYANSSAQGIGSDVRAFVVGVQLNIPLYQGGAIDSRVREAIANQEKARQDVENAKRTVALQTRQAYLGVTSGLGQVKALEQAVASTQLQLESTKLGQEVGVRTAVDVLNADQQLSHCAARPGPGDLQHHPEPVETQGRGGQARRGGPGRHQRTAQG